MSTLLNIETIDIQHDWNISIKGSDNERFWVSCRLKGQSTSNHGDIDQNALLNAPQRCNRFTVNKCNPYSVSITSQDGNCTTTFLAPYNSVKLHNKLVHCVDISSSEALGLCSSNDGKMWIWDTSTGETRRTLDGHVGDVYSCRFFPSGVVVLSGGADTRLKIWSIQDGSCARTLTGHKRVINDTAIIDKGKNIISVAADGVAKLWDCGSTKCISDLANLGTVINCCALGMSHEPPHQQINELECGTADKLLLLACENGAACTIDVASRKQVFTKQMNQALNCCTFLSDYTAVWGGDKGEIISFDLRNTRSELKRVIFSPSQILSLAAAGEQCIASCGDGICYYFSTEDPSNNLVKLTGSNLDAVNSVKAIGNTVYTACKDGIVRSYDLQQIV